MELHFPFSEGTRFLRDFVLFCINLFFFSGETDISRIRYTVVHEDLPYNLQVFLHAQGASRPTYREIPHTRPGLFVRYVII